MNTKGNNTVFDFDRPVDRHATGCVKYDDLQSHFGREDLVPLWVADMDFEVAPAISDAIKQRINHTVYGYAVPPQSYWDSIIRWLDKRYSVKATREEITYVPGIVRGIALVVNFFTKPGDAILIQPPVYHPFKNVSEGNGRRVVANPLRLLPDGRYEMDFENLEEVVKREQPKLMIMSNPHNPAGIQWSEDDLRRVADIADRNGMIVISDEIHGDLMLDGKRHISFATVSDAARRVSITFGAPSKTFNIAGIVSSWVYIPDQEIRTPFFHWLEVNEFSSPTFFATIATEAAYNEGGEWLDALLRYLEGNATAVDAWLSDNLPQVKALRPDASFLIWLDCRELGLDQQSLVDLFVNKAGLALNDGSMFGAGGEGFMRLNIGTQRNVLIEALQRLADAVKN